MKKLALILALALLAATGGYYGLLAYSEARDKQGEQTVLSAMAAVEAVKQKSGSYPAEFDPPAARVWGILPGPEVTYHFDGANCIIYYAMWPLGPLNVLDCRRREWSYED